MIVGVDVGGTNIRLGTVDSSGGLYREELQSSRQQNGGNVAEYLLRHLQSYISSSQDVKAVSIGFPSTIDKDRQRLINTPNLPGLNNIPIKDLYEKALGLPVFIGKDATMLLYHDLYRLQIKDRGIIVGVYIGTGIGNSIIINGKELVGNDGVACELGHIPVIGRHDICSCGLTGCLELYAGGKALERISKEAFPTTPINEVFQRHGDAEPILQFISDIADGVIIEINILNPSYIVLGGGVLQMEGFPREKLKRTILERTRRPVPGDALNIVFSDNSGPYNGVIGAALYASRQLESFRSEMG